MTRPRKFNKQALAQFAQKNTRTTKPSTSSVLAVLCHYCGDDLLAWPSAETISKETKLSERSVWYALKELRELGEITVVERGSVVPGKFGKSTCYYISICSEEFQHVAPDELVLPTNEHEGRVHPNLQNGEEDPAKNAGSKGANLQSAVQQPTSIPAITAPKHKETFKPLYDAECSDDFFRRFCGFLQSHHSDFAHNWLSKISDAKIADNTLCVISLTPFTADQLRNRYSDIVQHAAKLAGGVFNRFEVKAIQVPRQ